MNSIQKITYIILGFLLLSIPGFAQFSTCDTNLINAHLNPAGYYRVYVPTQPCSMYFHSTTTKYGIDAHRDAANLGIPQVVIDNLQENNDLSAALFAQGVYNIAGTGADVWLGLTDSATLYNFQVISTGAPAPFFNWTPGDPNNLAPACKVGGSCAFCFGADAYWCLYGEDCVVMNASGQWLDNACQGTNVKRVVVLELNTCPVLTKPRDTAICSGNSVNLTGTVASGGTAPYTYTWNPGGLSGSTVSVSPTTTTTYTVEASDHYLCKTDSSFTISVSTATPPTINAAQATVCANTADNISLNTVSGTATYTWSFGAGATVVSGSGGGPYSVKWSSTGIKTISVSVADNGCNTTASTTVNVTSTSAAFTLNPSNTCVGQNVTATVTTPSGTGTYNWNLNGGTVVTGSGSGPYTVNWSTAGTQTVNLTVTDNGCTATASNTVNITSAPSAAFTLNPSATACPGQPVSATLTGAASGTATYAWSWNGGTVLSGTGSGPYSVSWNALGSKNVTLTVTDGVCTGTATQSINIANSAVANAGADIQICPGVASSLGVAPTGGYTYSWFPAWGLSSTTIANPTVTIPSNLTGNDIDTFYVLTATTGACSATDTVRVRIYPNVSSSFTVNPSTACPNSNVVVTYSGTASGTATYNWNFNGGTIISGSGAGPYTITWASTGTKNVTLTVTDNGCTSNSSNPVTIANSLAPAFTLNPSTTACASQPVSVTLSGAPSGTATYNWNFNGGTVISGSGAGPYSVSWSGSGTQNVDLTVTDGGCTGTTTQSITIANAITANAGPDIQICPGAVGNLGAAPTGGSTYSWSPIFGLSNPAIANPTISVPSNPTGSNIDTFYVLTVTSGTCTATDTVRVTLYPDVSSSFTINPTTTCQGSNVTVTFIGTASGSATYNWNFSGGTVVSGSGAGPYTVNWSSLGTQTVDLTVTDNGCAANSSNTVTISNSLTPAFTLNPSTTACAGQVITVTLTGTASGTATYNWNFNGGTVISGSGAGPYSISWNTNGIQNVDLTVTDGGCTGTAPTQSIAIANSATANAGADIQLCPGTTGNLGAAPTGGYTYSWSPAWGLSSTTIANPTVTIPSNPTGSNIDTFYVLTVSSGSCAATDTVNVTIYPDINTSFNVSSSGVCTGDNVTVTYGGTVSGTATYTWNFSGANVVSGSGAGPYVINWTTSGSQVITLDVTDNGCNGTQSTQTVAVGLKPTAVAGSDQTTCSSATLQLGAAAVAGVTYAWSPTTHLSNASIANPTFTEVNTNASPDVTQYMLIANGGGCPDTAYVTITDNPVLPIDVVLTGAASFCQGDSIILSDTISGQVNYQWSTAATTSSIIVKTSGTYSVSAQDANSCLYISNPSVTVTVNPNPTVSLAANGEVDQSCTGVNDGSLTVQATGSTPAYSFGWSTAPPQIGATASSLAPGAYQVMVMDNNGCMDSATYTVNPAPFIGINIDSFRNISCYQRTDGAVYTSVTGGNLPLTYLWSTGAVTPAITNLNADTFSVTATDARGCAVDTSIIITQPGPITITPISNLHISYGGSEQIELNITPASSNYTYNWSPGTALSCINCPDPVASPLQTTTYTLTVTDATAGCSAIDTIKFYVDPTKSFYIPNAFTPNGDGINDTYMVFASGPVRFFEIEIFDRWGEKMYESNDMGTGWDGTYRGVLVSNGNYVYQVTITFLDGQTQTCKGSLTVLR